jgi:hypothetical protein
MKNFENFTERKDTRNIDENTFNELLNENCKEFNFDDLAIYRGVALSEEYYLIDPKLFTRTSRSTQNYYTLIMSESPYWKNIPPRNKSIICTFNKNLSGGYGNTYRVIPYDNSKWGVSKTWIKIFHRGVNLMDVNEYLDDIFKSMNVTLVSTNYEIMMSQFNFYSDEFLKLTDNKIGMNPSRGIVFDKIRRLMNDKNIKLDQAMLEYLKPNENILSCSYKKLINRWNKRQLHLQLNEGCELWTDSKCLLQRIKKSVE